MNRMMNSSYKSTLIERLDFGGDTSRPNPKAFIHEYNQKHREDFNPLLFERSDEDTIEHLKNVILSCQRDRYFTLKVLSFRVIDDYEEIKNTLWQHEESKRKPNDKKFENPYDYINLKDSDIILLEVVYFIRINANPMLKPEERESTMTVYIAIPRFVDKYYFRISGNFYSAMLQIVDGSVYNNSASKSKKQSVTMKTMFMPIRMFRLPASMITADGEEIKCVNYVSNIFNKYLEAMKYIFARYGLYGAFQFMEIENIYILKEPMYDSEQYYNFRKHNLIIAVPRVLFDNEPIVQAMCTTIYNNIAKDTTLDDVFDPRFWLKALGNEFKSPTIDKGIPVLDSLESTYDITTKNALRLPPEIKGDIYFILRWLMREFSTLRMRDNLDATYKRVRLPAEYMSSLYAMKVLKGIYRISDEGKNITVDQIKRAIYTQPMYILSVINQSKLVSYVDQVNDNDAAIALDYTYKGLSGLGDKDAGNGSIPVAYRFTHPSQLGRVDLDSSSPSDPGLSGILCPHTDIYENGYFEDYQEPNDWNARYNEFLIEYNNLVRMKDALHFTVRPGFEYDNVKEDIIKETMSSFENVTASIAVADQKINNGDIIPVTKEVRESNEVVSSPFANLIIS